MAMLDFYAPPAQDPAVMLEEHVPAAPKEAFIVSISDSELYDTDVETELPRTTRRSTMLDTSRTSVSCMMYTRQCEKLRMRVQDHVMKQLNNHTLSVHHGNQSTQGIIALSNALKDNLSVEELNLSDNAIDGDGACYIADCLLRNKNITKVDLSNNSFSSKGAIAMGQLLKHNSTIQTIDLSHNKFEENDGQFLAAGLEWNEKLKEINLSHNNLSQDGAGFVGVAIGKNDSIEKLNISWNHIRRSGAVSFCKPLQRNYTLVELNVSWNGFGYEGALAIGKLIQKNGTLKHIDASYNHINWKGAALIGEGLRRTKTLHTIKLGGNPLTTTGCMDMIEHISKKTCHLHTLDITGVPVIGEFEMMASAIQQTRPFRYIHGGIVGTHDVLGQKREKRVDPMQRVIDYMRERELRPTELFRSFDKAVGNKLSHRDFIDRLKRSGIPVPKHEYEELILQIESANDVEDGSISYKKMVDGVKEQIEKERLGRIKKREKEKRFRRRNQDILDKELPAIRDQDSDGFDEGSNSIGRQTSFVRSQGRQSATFELFRNPSNSITSMGLGVPGVSNLSSTTLGIHGLTGALSSRSTNTLAAQLMPTVQKTKPPAMISMSADLDGKKEKKKKKKKKKKGKK